MKLSSKRDLYSVGISLMQFLGEHLHYTPRAVILFRIINCTILVVVLIFTNANFVRARGEMYVDTLESWISINHILIKYILFIYYKADIENIMETRFKYYWNYRNFNKSIVHAVERTYSIVKSIENFLMILTVFLMYMIFLQPILYKETVFLVETWIFTNSVVLDAIVLICQYYTYVIVIPIVVGYDIWYMIIGVDLIIQIRLVKYSLQHISSKSLSDGVTQIRLAVQHQLILLSVFNKLRRVYSMTMLFHYFVTLITACSDMFQLLIGDTSFVNCLLKIPTLLFIFGEFAYYAVLAEQMSLELVRKTFSFYALIKNLLDK